MVSETTPSFSIAIMAAGKGTRMKSEQIAKVMHTLAGRSMIAHVLHAGLSLEPENIQVIIGHQAELVKAHVQNLKALPQSHLHWVEQREQLGTGHAIMQLQPQLKDYQGHLMIMNGDLPLIHPETLKNLLNTHFTHQNAGTLLTTHIPNPTGYGRIVRVNGEFVRITEHKDASPEELKINEINTGVYVFSWPLLNACLNRLSNNNAKGEYYLTDVIQMLREAGHTLGTVVASDHQEVLGVNSRDELAHLESVLRQRINQNWMQNGVTLRDPASIYIDCEVEIGVDTEILPGTCLQGQTRIGTGCILGPQTQIIDSEIGDQTSISFSVVKEAQIDSSVQIGPFAHIRPESQIDAHAKVGNFVELKKAHLHAGAKASHLSYLGDVTVGEKANIGAGTITCNYDGARKHPIHLGKNAFTGSNSTLVAPLTIGEDAYIAAGSVITEDVPAGALALGRARQVNKEGWAAKKRPKK